MHLSLIISIFALRIKVLEMAITAFISRIIKVSIMLKSLMMYLVIKVDDAHFWGEQFFFKIFMLHERLSSGNSWFSSVYAVVMKALIPSYPEVLSEDWNHDFENLYHIGVPLNNDQNKEVNTSKQQLYIKWVDFTSNKFGVVVNPIKTMMANLRNSLHLLQKQVYGQLELYKENFK